MKEKFLIKPYFENLFLRKRNISLKSLENLPSEIKLFLDHYLKNLLMLYRQKIYNVSVKPSNNNEELLLIKEGELPPLKEREFLLLILPMEKTRFIFQTVVEEVLEEAYRLRILDPRVEKRYKISNSIPVFLSYIPEKNVLNFLTQDYLFIRDSNLSFVEEIETLKEIYFFDLILNSKEQLEEDFMRTINKVHLRGELVNISRGGLGVKTSDLSFPLEENMFFYVRFQLDLFQEQIFKFGLLCHLRNLRNQNPYVFLHLMFFSKINSQLWEKLISRLKILLD